MPVLNIGGQSVNVSDDFLRLSPNQQDATVDEIARSIGVQGGKKPGTTFDAEAARRAGYTDTEINGVQKALAAGYTPQEISAHLSQRQQPSGGKLGTVQTGPWDDYKRDPVVSGPWLDYQKDPIAAPQGGKKPGYFDDIAPEPGAKPPAAKKGFFDDILPEGYQLDQPAANSLPPGFALDEPHNSVAGSAKAIGSGLAGGFLGLAGQPGDVKNAIFGALGEPPAPNPAPEGAYGKLVSLLERARGALELPTSNEVRNAVESRTGSLDYDPQTGMERVLKTGAEFAPAALNEGSLLRKAALVALPGVATEATKEAGGGPIAQTLAAVGGGVIGHKLTTPKAVTSMPTGQQVEAAGSAGYNNPAIDSVVFKGTAIPDLADDIVKQLGKRNEKLAPQTHAIVEGLKDPISGQTHTIEDLETARRLLGEGPAGNFNNKTDQSAATIAIKAIDRYMASNPQGDVLMGDIARANDALTTARSNVAHAKLSERVQEKLDNAELQAGSAHSGRNLDNATRQKLRTLLTSKKQGRGLTDDDIALIEGNVMGSGVGNTIRSAGNFLGGGGGLAALHSAGIGGGVGTMVGGPVGAVLGAVIPPAVGYATKKIGNAITRNKAKAIVENIIARSPEGQMWAASNQRIQAANPAPSVGGAVLLPLLRGLQPVW